jgi:hypothetical protein
MPSGFFGFWASAVSPAWNGLEITKAKMDLFGITRWSKRKALGVWRGLENMSDYLLKT